MADDSAAPPIETPRTDMLSRLFMRPDTCKSLHAMILDKLRQRYRGRVHSYHGRLFDAVINSGDKLVETVIVLAAIVNEPDVRQAVIQMCANKEKASVYIDWLSLPLKSVLQSPITPENAEATFSEFSVACLSMWMHGSIDSMNAELADSTKK